CIISPRDYRTMIYTLQKAVLWEGLMYSHFFATRRRGADIVSLCARVLRGAVAINLIWIAATAPCLAAITTATATTPAVREILAPFGETDLLETAFRDGVSAYESADYNLA